MLKYAYLGVGFALTVGSVQALPMGSLVDSSSGSQFIQSVRHDHHRNDRWDRNDRWRNDNYRNDWRYRNDGRYNNDWRYRNNNWRDDDDVTACLGDFCLRLDN